MSTNINKYDIFSQLDQQLVNQIKLFYLNKCDLLFTILDNSVIQYQIKDKQLNKFEPLCEKQTIIKFVSNLSLTLNNSNVGSYFTALTDNGCVYNWGDNIYGQLGSGSVGNQYEPKIVDKLREQFIVDICCGACHTLALTRYGHVYSFGLNSSGQCANNTLDNQLIPYRVNLSNVIAISCGCYHSIAMTKNGEVFGWGGNGKGQIGIEGSGMGAYSIKSGKILIPNRIKNVPIIKSVMCAKFCTFMISIDGDIYYCGTIFDYIISCTSKLNSNTKFIKIGATIHSELFVALSTDNVCFIFGRYLDDKNNQSSIRCDTTDYSEFVHVTDLKQTEFTSIDETFAFYEKITYKSIEIIKSKYESNFIELRVLGSGGFSTVFKALQKIDKKLYAIKKVCFKSENEETVTKELEFLSQLSSRFIVKYIDSWIEPNYYIDSFDTEKPENISSYNLLYSPNLPQLLHIQMELCPLTLRDAINIIMKQCINKSDSKLSLIGYYISSELLYEILECVQYLHSLNPKIIHRDIKPENILLTNFVNNRFVKLSDFGLSTFHEFADQSHTKYTGTKNYCAFELNFTTKYTTKVDNYSLGVVIQELFRIDNKDTHNNYLPILETNMKYLVNLVKKLLSYFVDDRPNCDQVLNEKHLWVLTDQQLLSDQQFKQIISKSPKTDSIEENFIEYFIQNKYNLVHAIDNIITQKLPSLPSHSNQSKVTLSLTTTEINEYEYYSDSLTRSDSGFGLQLLGGAEQGSHVSIGSIVIGGVAHRNDVLRVGDQIISINDINVMDETHQRVVQLFAQTGPHVSIKVRRKKIATSI